LIYFSLKIDFFDKLLEKNIFAIQIKIKKQVKK